MLRPTVGRGSKAIGAAVLNPLSLAGAMALGLWLVGLLGIGGPTLLAVQCVLGPVFYLILFQQFDRPGYLEMKKALLNR